MIRLAFEIVIAWFALSYLCAALWVLAVEIGRRSARRRNDAAAAKIMSTPKSERPAGADNDFQTGSSEEISVSNALRQAKSLVSSASHPCKAIASVGEAESTLHARAILHFRPPAHHHRVARGGE